MSVRRSLDEVLERPLQKEVAEQHDAENWGRTPEAIMAAEQADAMFSEWDRIPEAVSA